MPAESPPLLVDRVESGRRLGLSPRTIDGLIKRNELPAVRVGRRVLLDPRDLEAWIDRQKAAQAAGVRVAG